mmetsp:Transcript_3162/g.5828  ORF Transcript_3162/g.5828 Transcript_3162/m.5828 type:complete len:268 (-) Transcript_3162:354-1157(-)
MRPEGSTGSCWPRTREGDKSNVKLRAGQDSMIASGIRVFHGDIVSESLLKLVVRLDASMSVKGSSFGDIFIVAMVSPMRLSRLSFTQSAAARLPPADSPVTMTRSASTPRTSQASPRPSEQYTFVTCSSATGNTLLGRSEYSGQITIAFVAPLQSRRNGMSLANVCAKNPPPVKCKIMSFFGYNRRGCVSVSCASNCRPLSIDVSSSDSARSSIVDKLGLILLRLFLFPLTSAAERSGDGSRERTKQGTPAIVIRSAMAAPFNNRDA